MSFYEIAKRTKAYECLDCAVCTGSCPVSRLNPDFSPRLTVRKAIYGLERRVLDDPDLWSCLTCKLCSDRCPHEVDYVEFIKSARRESFSDGRRGVFSHDGLIQTLMELTGKNVSQDRTYWINGGLKASRKSSYLLFVGCLPYFDVAFESYELSPLRIARDALKLLNSIGIKPIVSNDERCCGHDLLWGGDLDNFKALARLNLELIERSKVKQVIFLCPECYYTVKEDYPRHFGELGFEPIHIAELLVHNLGKLKLQESARKLTYHDSCRMGRYLGIYDNPRELIAAIPGAELREMDRNRENALCCGTGEWTNCFNCSKKIQTEGINRAISTGADLLVTSCPKCQIHFRCAMRGGAPELEMMDLVSLLAEALKS